MTAAPHALRWRQRIGIALLVAAGRLPGRRHIGALLGLLAYAVARRRRHIAAVNLRLTLPHLPPAAQRRLLRRHFIGLGEWCMDNLWALSASRAAVCRHFALEGEMPPAGSIVLTPHFLGLELALLRLNLAQPESSIAYHYKPMHSAFWDAVMQRLRARFGSTGFSTLSKHALLAAVRHCRGGGLLCYLPDIDPRARKSTVYVPFMAVQEAATTTGVARLAKAARAAVVPYIICRRRGGGYVGKLLPPLQAFPSGDEVADATQINALIAHWVEAMPENYYWLHRRFKTDRGGATAHYDPPAE